MIYKNHVRQLLVDEFQIAVWWYATHKKVMLGSLDGDMPSILSSGGIER